ncbi:ABC transporter permease [Pseudomonas sp. St290]|uniref:ABC transporter permease n=1 Tax=Pseudomonas sp. St290 TaxID=1602166 RepID=UPI001BB403BD|nr:ABC transporter permease [Pseudomonas sp. St290]BBH32630.1 ABC-type uncharacterized transport system, permease component [Pseudomonas sp. St290]
MVYAVAILAGLAATSGLILVSGAPLGSSFSALAMGAIGSRSALVSSLVAATPLLLTGLATVIAYRAGVWTVGQEGQVLAGGMTAYQASLWLSGVPPVLAIPGCILAGVAGGAALGGLASFLKSRFAISEIVSTVMLNYLAGYLLSYLLTAIWSSSGGGVSYQQTPILPEGVWLPALGVVGKLHPGIIVAIIATICLHILMNRTALGYEVRAMGINPVALRQRGTDTIRTTLVVMLISGGLSALAGVGEIFGVSHRLTTSNLTGIGFDGIIIGMIGNLSPLGTLLSALFFGALHSGALFMNVMTGVPAALITALQGLILLFFLMAGIAAQFELVRERS